MDAIFLLAFAVPALAGVFGLIGVWVSVRWLYRRVLSARVSSAEAACDSGSAEKPSSCPAGAHPADAGNKRRAAGNGAGLHSPLIRFAVVAVIALALLVPLALVRSLVSERAGLYRDVVAGISRTSGGSQRIAGPFLLIPFTERVLVARSARDGGDGNPVRESRVVGNYLVVLPERVEFSGRIEPEERRRGIYRSLAYTTDLTMQGTFTLPASDALERVAPAMIGVDYAKAFVVMGLSYPGALREVGPFAWNGADLKAEPGAQPFSEQGKGYRIPVRLSPQTKTYAFAQRLTLSGSGGIRFAPAGETTAISLASPWPHPSFRGDILPRERRVSAEGFTAAWSIPSLARPYPSLGTVKGWPSAGGSLEDDFPAGDFLVGVDLYESGTHYQLVGRSVKYGILFIGLTFLAFIVFEMTLAARLHPVQYGLVGLSMVVFYLVLLSLAEHASFAAAYGAAAACTILMISAYVWAALRNTRQAAAAALLLVALYTLLYAILQMEDYALLMGTALVLIMLGALMAVSRNLARAGD